MRNRNAVFGVVEEENCPLYIVGDEFRIKALALTVSRGKPVCLALTNALMSALEAEHSTAQGPARLPGGPPAAPRRGRHECDGCEGRIRFEAKKSTDGFATPHMKMLAAAERQAGFSKDDERFALLRGETAFADLDDDELRAFCALGELESYDANTAIVRCGETAERLFIVLSGRVLMSGADGEPQLVLERGELFGETSLLPDMVYPVDYDCLERTELLTFTAKRFKGVLGKYPALQVFCSDQLSRRVKRAGGLSGNLDEVGGGDLCQLVHSSRMTGRLRLSFGAGDGGELLFNAGELVAAKHGGLSGREAFFSLIARSEGVFNFIAGLAPAEAALPPLGDFMALLMAGAQRLDEG